jgi:3'(2'), 5'-bisphosphate nucleotidase
MPHHISPALARLAEIAHEAGGVILKHYGAVEARAKPDSSPVTAADEEAEALILKRLGQTHPEYPVIAEESAARGDIPPLRERFILVDPLDGTKEFLKRNGEFTVNIAVVSQGIPIAGVVYAPALSRMFAGSAGEGAFEIAARSDAPFDAGRAQAIRARKAPPEGLTAAISRTHGDTKTEEYLAAYKIAHLVTAGSSLKFCLIAAGEADLYPRHGPTMEWDTAAGHAVVNAAGGSVTQLDGSPFLYGKAAEGFRNSSFVARGLV